MKHETEHLIRIPPNEMSQIEERRQSQASVSLRDKAAQWDLLHDAVEGNPFQRVGRLEGAVDNLSDKAYYFPALNKEMERVVAELELLKLCLQRYAHVLLQAQISNIAQRQAGEDVNRSPEAMRRCERNAKEQ